MRIGIDARFYGTTGKGLGRYTEKLIAELERLDQENDYVIFLSRENFEAYLPSSPRFRKVLAWPRWYTLSEQLFLPFLLRRERLDLVHFPHFNVPLLYRRPFLFTLHDLILFHFPTLRASSRSRALYWLKFAAYRLVLSSALTRAREVIAVSRFTEADILSHFPWVKPKLSVTYEAAEASCRAGTETEKHALFERAGLLRPETKGARVVYCLHTSCM
jgi:glycosyltransferase involved in cell wall biosynthesis